MERPEPGDVHAAWHADVAHLATDVDRVATRLRGLTEARLRQPVPGYPTVADAGRALAQALADAGQGVAGRAAEPRAQRRTVPRLADTVVADQVAVTGHDLVSALAGVAPDAAVSSGADPVSARDLLAATADLVRDVKLRID